MITYVSGGMSGVWLKLNFLLRRLYSTSLGLIRENQRRSKVSSACWSKVSHWFKGKTGCVLQTLVIELFLNVRIQRSAALRQWFWSGSSWELVSLGLILNWINIEISLSLVVAVQILDI